MRAAGQGRRARSLSFINTLLLSSAIALPAMAQIETVVVTAQKKSEDIQTVPVAVTAFGAADLEARQIEEFRDLQFAVPSVSFTKSNFSGSNFQVRGIGVTAVGTSADTGVAIHINDAYLNAPRLAEAEYFDVERLEVLRGPQSTLYGRNATGGSVNVITAKPDLDMPFLNVEGTYGNYNTQKAKATINIPLVDGELGLRGAGVYTRRDGFSDNIFTGDSVDNRDLYSVRGSLRWQPDEDTTIDLMASYFHEDDNRVRAQKQMCNFDPTGVLGCLPNGRSFDHLNPNSTLATIFASEEGISTLLSPALGPSLGLWRLGVQVPLVPGVNPTDFRKINSDFTPVYYSDETFYQGSWEQNLDWVTMNANVSYQKTSVWSQAHYNNIPGAAFSPAELGLALGTLAAIAPAHYAAFFAAGAATNSLPTSGIGGNGVTGGNILSYDPRVVAFDQSDGWAKQWTGELRFTSNLDGPLNFMIAGFWMDFEGSANYWVNANTLDYAGIVIGRFAGAPVPFCSSVIPGGIAPGCVLAPTNYYNNTPLYTLDSKAVFGELYWDAVPDELKFTLGLRWTSDEKETTARTTLYNCVMPIGTVDPDPFLASSNPFCAFDADPGVAGRQLYSVQEAAFKEWTGRFVMDWTPEIDFTDATLIYASYSRGFKSGGMNPPLSVGAGVPRTFEPELVDAYEVGTKNTLLDATLQANIALWWYDYSGLQVSKIVQRTSVNENIDAKLWGVEGEFLYAPDENWTFNFTVAHTNSEIGDVASIDPRNVGAGRSDAIVVKAIGQASNCVIYRTAGSPTPTPADIPAFAALGFFNPPGGSAALAGAGVPLAIYGPTCDFASAAGMALAGALAGAGFSVSDPLDPGRPFGWDGVPVSLDGNELQNTPDYTFAFGAQYTTPINDYTLSMRVDYYWQSDMWGRIFNAGAADEIASWDVTNASMQLTAPENEWYAKLFVSNLFNNDNITGMYLTDHSSGLFTNVFLGDPRVFGITLGTTM